jgi:hypothetical protein
MGSLREPDKKTKWPTDRRSQFNFYLTTGSCKPQCMEVTHLVMRIRKGSTPSYTGCLTVSSNMTLTLTTES